MGKFQLVHKDDREARLSLNLLDVVGHNNL